MSPRIPKQSTELRGNSRERIILAGLELFTSKGYHSTSVSQIAKKAEVAKGLIYNYFASKEDLLLAIMHFGIDEMGGMEELFSIPDPKEQLSYLISHFFKLMREQTELVKLFFTLSLQFEQFQNEQIKGLADQKYAGYLGLLTQLLTATGIAHPKEETYLLMAQMDGIALQYLTLREDLPMDTIEAYMLSKYCKP